MATKLNENSDLNNPLFIEEAGQYLELNGFHRRDSSRLPGQIVYFIKDDLLVEIYGDTVEFKYYHGGANGVWKTFIKYDGIQYLNTEGWIWLFHITKVVSIKKFFTGVIKEGVSFRPSDILAPLLNHFKVTDNHQAVPLGY